MLFASTLPLSSHIARHTQSYAELRGTLQQQILVGTDDERDIGRRSGKLHTQVRPYAGRFAGSDRQRVGKGSGIHRLVFLLEAVLDKRTVAQLAQPVLVLLVGFECG